MTATSPRISRQARMKPRLRYPSAARGPATTIRKPAMAMQLRIARERTTRQITKSFRTSAMWDFSFSL